MRIMMEKLSSVIYVMDLIHIASSTQRGSVLDVAKNIIEKPTYSDTYILFMTLREQLFRWHINP
jgi:hypothetical protein